MKLSLQLCAVAAVACAASIMQAISWRTAASLSTLAPLIWITPSLSITKQVKQNPPVSIDFTQKQPVTINPKISAYLASLWKTQDTCAPAPYKFKKNDALVAAPYAAVTAGAYAVSLCFKSSAARAATRAVISPIALYAYEQYKKATA